MAFRAILRRAFPLALVLSFALLAAATRARAVGITGHGEIAFRASGWFDSQAYPSYRDWILADLGSLEAGAAFPDWGYSFGFSNESEEAHWPPFHEAASTHIRSRYPGEWGEDARKLAVFLLGIRSHWIADLDWHGLGGVEEGFLNAMAGQEFHGSFSAAHDHGDFGGDVMASYELDLGWMIHPWYVPSHDLEQIYRSLGYETVTARDLTFYMGLLMVASRAEKAAAHILFPRYAKPSPFLVSDYQDYFVGGVDAMAAHTIWSWEEMIGWMENGVPISLAGPPGLLGALRTKVPVEVGPPGPAASLYHSVRGLPHHEALERLGVEVAETARGAFLSWIPTAEQAGANASAVDEPHVPPLGEERSVILTSGESYGYLGASLATADFDGDGRDDLVVGSPGYGEIGKPQLGRVRVVFGRSGIEEHEQVSLPGDTSAVVRTGSEPGGRFGWAVSVVDANADGKADLAVSAPTTGARDYGYFGKVLVYLGDGEGGLSEAPDLTIRAVDAYTNLGWSLAGEDADGDGFADLIVGSPLARSGGRQRGLIAVFLADPALASGAEKVVGDADWIATGSTDWEWFGTHFAVADLGSGGMRLLVGAPKFTNGSIQGVGRLYGFDMGGMGGAGASTSPVFTITGDSELDNTGAAFDFGDPGGTGSPLLALASPTASPAGAAQAGTVDLLSISDLAGDSSLASLPKAATLTGTSAFGRFGWRVAFADANGDGVEDLWVTEPWRKGEGSREYEEGAAYLWSGGDSFPSGLTPAATSGSAAWILKDTTKNALFGSAIAFPDSNGDGFADAAIGSRRDATTGPLAGNVRVILTPSPEIVSASPKRLRIGATRTLTIEGKRFHEEGLSIKISRGSLEIAPSSILSVTPTEIQAAVSIPPDAEEGTYDLVVEDVFGRSSIPGRLDLATRSGSGCGTLSPGGSHGGGRGLCLGAVLGFLGALRAKKAIGRGACGPD